MEIGLLSRGTFCSVRRVLQHITKSANFTEFQKLIRLERGFVLSLGLHSPSFDSWKKCPVRPPPPSDVLYARNVCSEILNFKTEKQRANGPPQVPELQLDVCCPSGSTSHPLILKHVSWYQYRSKPMYKPHKIFVIECDLRAIWINNHALIDGNY